MQIERRFLTSPAAKIEGDEKTKRIGGHASVFFDGSPSTEFELWPGVFERIMPTAFDRALAERDDVVALVNHDDSMILGRTLSGTLRLSKDTRGLKYEIDPPDTTIARDTLVSLERGDLSGASFAFTVSPSGQRWFQDGDREIREITSVDRLFDVSVVTFGAYQAADSGLRRAEGVAEVRAARDAWKASQPPAPKFPKPDDEFDFRLAEARLRRVK